PLHPSSASRLITLTGPGGSGKTRLALAVAERVVETFSGAVWFVSLADLTQARRIGDAIADSLRLPCAPMREPLEQATEVRNGLRPQPPASPANSEQALSLTKDVERGGSTPTSLTQLPSPSLLVLDNFEQLVEDGTAILQSLLERVPALTCLVT